MKLILLFNFSVVKIFDMLICHCKGMNERALRRVVRAGARCVTDVTRDCGAGSVCGGCLPAIQDIVDEDEATGNLQPLALDLAPAH